MRRDQSRLPNFAATDFDPCACPKDYEQFWLWYYPYTVAFVQKQGIEWQSAEDVATDILIKFQQRDFLSEFDPNKVIVRGGQKVPPRFKTFVNAFINAYCMGKRDKQTINRRREPVICDNPIGDSGATWLDFFGPSYDEDFLSRLEENHLIQSIRAYLVTVPRRSDKDRADMPALFDAVVAHVRLFGKVDNRVLAKQFGVSMTAMHSWIGMLRTHIRAALNAERPVAHRRPSAFELGAMPLSEAKERGVYRPVHVS